MKKVISNKFVVTNSIKDCVDAKYEQLKGTHFRASPIDFANMLQDYCYNTLGVSSNELWDYIDDITGVDEY